MRFAHASRDSYIGCQGSAQRWLAWFLASGCVCNEVEEKHQPQTSSPPPVPRTEEIQPTHLLCPWAREQASFKAGRAPRHKERSAALGDSDECCVECLWIGIRSKPRQLSSAVRFLKGSRGWEKTIVMSVSNINQLIKLGFFLGPVPKLLMNVIFE